MSNTVDPTDNPYGDELAQDAATNGVRVAAATDGVRVAATDGVRVDDVPKETVVTHSDYEGPALVVDNTVDPHGAANDNVHGH